MLPWKDIIPLEAYYSTFQIPSYQFTKSNLLKVNWLLEYKLLIPSTSLDLHNFESHKPLI